MVHSYCYQYEIKIVDRFTVYAKDEEEARVMGGAIMERIYPDPVGVDKRKKRVVGPVLKGRLI